MDRDNNFDRLKKSYDAMCYLQAPIYMTPEELIDKLNEIQVMKSESKLLEIKAAKQH